MWRNAVALEYHPVGAQTQRPRDDNPRAIRQRHRRRSAPGAIGRPPDEQHAAHGLDAGNKVFAGTGTALVNEHRHPALVGPRAARLDPADGLAELVCARLPPEINADDDRLFDEAPVDLVGQLIAAAAIAPNVNHQALEPFELLQRLVDLRNEIPAAPLRDSNIAQ